MSVISDLEDKIDLLAIAIATAINNTRADVGDKNSLATVAKGSLVLALNEVYAMAEAAGESGGAQSLNELTDVQTSGGAPAGHILRGNGTNFVNVLGTDHFDAAGSAAAAQAASQPANAELALIAAMSTTAFGRGFLSLANAAALAALIPTADESTKGLVELANNSEALAGLDDTRALTPAGGAALISQLIGAAPADLNEWSEVVARIQASDSDIDGILTSLTNKLTRNAHLDSFAGLTPGANQFAYSTGANTWAMATITADARGMLAAGDKAAIRTFLDVYSKGEIGTSTHNFVNVFQTALSS